jgi:hypothetical protein
MDRRRSIHLDISVVGCGEQAGLGTNLQFEDGEFNFVKTRAEHGVKRAFKLRDDHFEVPEPE